MENNQKKRRKRKMRIINFVIPQKQKEAKKEGVTLFLLGVATGAMGNWKHSHKQSQG